MSVTVIGVAGQKQNGKDCLANYLASKLRDPEGQPWGRRAFATQVKKIFCDTFDKTMEFVEEWKEVPEPPPGMEMPVRQALQFIGSGFRKIQGNIWIELATRHLWQYQYTIFSDCRYVNEVTKIKQVGGVTILLYRPGFLNSDPNSSEAQIRPFVEWCASTGQEGVIREWSEYQQCSKQGNKGLYNTVTQSNWNTVKMDQDFLDNLGQFDFFLRNDGDLAHLYNKADRLLVPYLQDHEVV